MASEASADLTALVQQMEQAGANAQDAVMHALMDSANYLAALMKSLAPVDTGNLRDSIGVRLGESGSVIIGPNVAQAPYAGYVEFGTAPHDIYPKTARALRFTMNGRTVFARVVHHPGTQPAYYVAHAFEQWQQSLGDMAAETGAQLILGGGQQ